MEKFEDEDESQALVLSQRPNDITLMDIARFDLVRPPIPMHGHRFTIFRNAILVSPGISTTVLLGTCMFAYLFMRGVIVVECSILLIFFSCIGSWIYIAYHRKRFRELGPVQYLRQHDLWLHRYFYGENSPAVVVTYIKIGKVYLYLNQPEQAEQVCRELFEKFPVLSTHPGGARCFETHGRILTTLKRYDQALEAYLKGLELRQVLAEKNPYSFVNTQKLVALAYQRLGRVDMMIKHLEEASDFLEERNLQESIDMAKVNILKAQYHKGKGDTRKCLLLLKKAEEIYLFNVGGFPRSAGIAKLYEELGSVHDELGHRELGKTYMQDALEIYRRCGYSHEEASLLRKLESGASDV